MSLTSTNGQKIRGFRKQNKMSQSELGAIVGKSYRTICSYELGTISVPNSVVSVLNSKYKLGLKSSKSTKSSKSSSVKTSSVKTSSVKSTKSFKPTKMSKTSKTTKVVASTTSATTKKSRSVDLSSVSFSKKSSVSSRFSSLRKSSGLTQGKFAKMLSTNQTRVNRLESGKTSFVPVSTLKSLVKSNVNLNSLFA